MLKNIRIRLLVTYLVLIALTLGLAGTYSSSILRQFGRERATAALTTKAADLKRFIHELGAQGDLATILAWYDRIASHADGIRLMVTSPSGETVFDPANMLSPLVRSHLVPNPQDLNDFWMEPAGADTWTHLTTPLEAADKTVIGFADLSVSQADVLPSLRAIMVANWYLAAALAILALGLSSWMLKPLFEPLREIQNVADRMASGDLDIRVELRGGGELERLGQTINKLSDEIQNNILTIVEEKNKLDAILSSLVDGVVTVGQDGTITFLNQTATRILSDVLHAEVPQQDGEPRFRGRHLKDLPLSGPLIELLQSCQSLDSAISREMKFGEREFTVFAIPLGLHGQLLLLRDVTGLKQLETARNQFLGNVSHELKTPLTIIKGFVVTLQKSPDITDEWKRYLDYIDRETDRLARLVDDLLNLARLRSKRTQMNFGFCEPSEVIHDSFRQLQPQAQKYDTSLVLSCPDNLPVLLADTDRVKEIIINLVDNAFKYTPPKGRVELSAEATNEYLLVRIHDQGPGIPLDEIPYLFERFFRGTDKAGRKSGGSGIGLAIVKEIVDMHGGDIHVESKAGEGTTFVVSLPLRQQSRRPQEKPAT